MASNQFLLSNNLLSCARTSHIFIALICLSWCIQLIKTLLLDSITHMGALIITYKYIKEALVLTI